MIQAVYEIDSKIIQDKSKAIIVPCIDLLPELGTERQPVFLLPAPQEGNFRKIL